VQARFLLRDGRADGDDGTERGQTNDQHPGDTHFSLLNSIFGTLAIRAADEYVRDSSPTHGAAKSIAPQRAD
jgi:hypothetical protein